MTHRCWFIVFSFSFSSVYFFISLEAFSFIRGLFRYVFFSIQMFGDFCAVFLLLICRLISLWWNTIYIISLLLICWDMAEHIFYLGYVLIQWNVNKMMCVVSRGEPLELVPYLPSSCPRMVEPLLAYVPMLEQCGAKAFANPHCSFIFKQDINPCSCKHWDFEVCLLIQ